MQVGLCHAIAHLFALEPMRLNSRIENIEYWAFFFGFFVTWTPAYAMLGKTMEACSTWCWSTWTMGFYYILRPKLHDINVDNLYFNFFNLQVTTKIINLFLTFFSFVGRTVTRRRLE